MAQFDQADMARRTVSMRGTSHTGMRQRNEKLVLWLIRRHGPLPKSDIARMTGLSAQTVSVIMRSLEQDQLLEKGKPVRGKVGQPSVPMGLCADGAFFLGLKIGRRRTEMSLIDFCGTVRGTRVATHDYPAIDGAIAFARASADALVSRLPTRLQGRVMGLGIGLPFRLWEWSDALNLHAATMADWQTRDIRAELDAQFDWPVLLENDASAACNAELILGGQVLPDNFLYAYLGFFIGGGLVLNGTLFSGASGNAGALASTPVPDGRGGAVQLVEVASLSTLEAGALQGAGDMWTSLHTWDMDPRFLTDWIDGAAKGLAHAAISAVALCDLDALVIDGWLPEAVRARLIDRIETEIAASPLAGIRHPAVLAGAAGPGARTLGAASLPLAARFLPA